MAILVMNADSEQDVFERWLQEECPSGDVESVQYQWAKSHARSDWLDKESFKLSLTGADEDFCEFIHSELCRLSPIDDLAAHHATLATLSPGDVVEVVTAMMHKAVQSSDIRGIMAMRAPLSAPEPPQQAVKASPVGLGYVADMDHRLGAWK